jgi:hypothetical protein
MTLISSPIVGHRRAVPIRRSRMRASTRTSVGSAITASTSTSLPLAM